MDKTETDFRWEMEDTLSGYAFDRRHNLMDGAVSLDKNELYIAADFYQSWVDNRRYKNLDLSPVSRGSRIGAAAAIYVRDLIEIDRTKNPYSLEGHQVRRMMAAEQRGAA